MILLLSKSHPALQAMSGAAKPADLNEPGLRRNPGEPSAEQAEADTYNKPRIQWQGLTIAIENPAGSVRRGRNRHGVSWEIRMRFDYGEIVGSMGVDGDPVDVYMGPNPEAPMVYVVHQRRVNDWTEYDEDKCMVGFDSQDDAEAAFLSNYNDPRFLGPVTTMPVAEFVAKVSATKEAPAMIKATATVVLFFKAHVGPYLRGGKIVNVAGYQGRGARAVPQPGQMSLFGSNKPLPPSPLKGKDPVASTPDMFDTPNETRAELIKEHERLVDVLNSPSHEDDKVEAKRQAKELAEYKGEKGETAFADWSNRETAPVGSWVKADYKLADSQPVYQVQELDVDSLYLPELDSSGRLQPEKRKYLEGYTQRAKAGERAPSINVIEMENGKMRVVDGHRRVMAARAAGKKTIRALVSPLIDTPDGKKEATVELIQRGRPANKPVVFLKQPDQSSSNLSNNTSDETQKDGKMITVGSSRNRDTRYDVVRREIIKLAARTRTSGRTSDEMHRVLDEANTNTNDTFKEQGRFEVTVDEWNKQFIRDVEFLMSTGEYDATAVGNLKHYGFRP